MRLYGDLAPWFHLLTSPDDYDVEAARYERIMLEAVPDARTLLELGSGRRATATTAPSAVVA